MGAQGSDPGSASALIDDTQPLLKQVGGGALWFRSPLVTPAPGAIARAAALQDASSGLIRHLCGLPAAAAAAAASLPCPSWLPPMLQLGHLDAAGYQAWMMRTSRGQARFFESSRLEAVTKVKW